MFKLFRKTPLVLIALIFIIGGLFLFSQNSKSYDDKTTHPGLTDEIVDFYNLSFDNELTVQEKEWIVQGSIDEDTPPRWINHFYDPIYKDGWSGEETGFWPTLVVQYFSSGALSSKKPVSSLDWIHNQELQSKYGAYQGNRTWERAIYEMVKNGNKREAYYTLGFILHLIEDASVPDHTRNDTHAHELRYATLDYGSPYEEFSKQYKRETLNIAKELNQKGDQPIVRSSIDGYLISLAEYSNKYFFSKDTISNEKYSEPDIKKIIERNSYGYGIDENGDEFPLVKIKISLDSLNQLQKEYLLEKSEGQYYPILSAYFSRLSRQAVLNGAGVIKLFLEEAEKAEKDKSLIKEEPQISWWQKMRSPLYGVIIPAYDSVALVFSSMQDVFSRPQIIDPMALVANIGQVAGNQAISNEQLAISSQQPEIAALPLVARNPSVPARADDREDGGLPGGDDIVVEIATPLARNDREGKPRNDNEIVKEMTQEEIDALVAEVKKKYGLVDAQSAAIAQNQPIAPLAPAFALATGVPDTNTEQTQDNQSQGETPSTDTGEPTITEYLTSPPAPIITTNNGQDYLIKKFAAQYPERQMSFTLEGTKAIDISKIRINDATDTVDIESTNWQKEIVLQEGENIFVVAAEYDTGNISDSATIKISLQFDNSTFYLTDYDVRKMNFTLNWGDTNGVIKEWELEYKLAPNFEWIVLANSSSLIANSFDFTAKYDDLTYYFRLRGQDENGEYIDWLTLEAEISTKPVVINEIAWRGTEASYNDEWIELANKTNKEIDLNGWILKTHYGEINKTLTGKIVANGFYLLERTADTTISNIMADQIYTGALRDAQNQYDRGDSIYLYDKDNNIVDQTRTALSGLGQVKRISSERISIWSNGNYMNNWLPYSGSGNQEAQDADGNPVFGTPRAQNSQANIYFALNSGVFEGIPSLSKDAIFLKNRSPYMANGSVEATNVEILIEPGASLEFNSFGMLRIHDGGELIAKGMENEKIIIKSATSDRTVLYFSGANGELENVEINGGQVAANNSTIKIANSAIKNANGLLTLQNSEFDISDSEFSGDAMKANLNGNYYGGEAILIKQSQGIIQNSEIKNNRAHGIYIDSLSGALDISGNNFNSNGIAPIATNGFIDPGADSLNLENNIIGANKALVVYNPFVNEGQTAIIPSNAPYFLYDKAKGNPWHKVGDPEVKAGGILKIEPGAVVNFNTNSFLKIYGKLEAVGTLEKPIVLRKDYVSYEDMVSNIVGTLTLNKLNESDHIQFYDGAKAEVVLENVIIRREFVDRYKNTYYQSYWLVNEPEEKPEVSGEPEDEDEPGESGEPENQEAQDVQSSDVESLEIVL